MVDDAEMRQSLVAEANETLREAERDACLPRAFSDVQVRESRWDEQANAAVASVKLELWRLRPEQIRRILLAVRKEVSGD